jgi:hypothetical protein
MKHPYVYCKWTDSDCHGRDRIWREVEAFKNIPVETCESLGFLVVENDDCYIIAAHKSSDNMFSGEMRIPKTAVLRYCPVTCAEL